LVRTLDFCFLPLQADTVFGPKNLHIAAFSNSNQRKHGGFQGAGVYVYYRIYIYISKYKNKKQYKRGWINTWRHRALEEDDQGMTNLKAISVAHHPGLAHMKEMTQ